MKCPKCGCDLEYPVGFKDQDDGRVYPVECWSCEWSGQEVYKMVFEAFLPVGEFQGEPPGCGRFDLGQTLQLLRLNLKLKPGDARVLPV